MSYFHFVSFCIVFFPDFSFSSTSLCLCRSGSSFASIYILFKFEVRWIYSLKMKYGKLQIFLDQIFINVAILSSLFFYVSPSRLRFVYRLYTVSHLCGRLWFFAHARPPAIIPHAKLLFSRARKKHLTNE